MIFQRLHNKRALYLDQQLFSREIEALRDHDWSEPLLESWVTCMLENAASRESKDAHNNTINCCEFTGPACKWTTWH